MIVALQQEGVMTDSILNSLPPIALPESTIDSLAKNENVGDRESTLAHYDSEIGEELVFNLVVKISGSWYALVLDEDGENGWKSLGPFSSFSDAGREISEWRRENDLDFS